MKFIDYIEPKNIELNMPFSSKKKLFEQFSRKMSENKKEEITIYDALVNREKVGTTSLSNGTAIPHGKCLEDREVRIALFVLNKAVNYESVDDTKVQLVVCTLFPKRTNDFHVQLLNNIGGFFKKHRNYRLLINAKSPEELYQIILRES